ncbi:hemagglutinin repeat-containing protein [Pseudomonas oryzihabitans]|uniref:hemagglutinin repeat-containing protein n=1 Tax=Pseudomonas oryzihabitans TaxID=47885 RepID=UPI0028956C21|nr:hemagglutinin repeat-containing protein [Pseudomonas oryzihabitans]MDT3723220.1 hemagglutinin repeat-containing protein [Pseudomonas oryzihabitans]
MRKRRKKRRIYFPRLRLAGRDVNLVGAQTQTGRSSGANNTSSSITQLTGSLTAGRDLGIGAGRDLTAVATTLSAGGNASLAAQDNLTLAAAADETPSKSKSKKIWFRLRRPRERDEDQ